jgi:hypothetical protein
MAAAIPEHYHSVTPMVVFKDARPAMQVVGIALFLALVGLAMTIYLAWVRGPA